MPCWKLQPTQHVDSTVLLYKPVLMSVNSESCNLFGGALESMHVYIGIICIYMNGMWLSVHVEHLIILRMWYVQVN